MLWLRPYSSSGGGGGDTDRTFYASAVDKIGLTVKRIASQTAKLFGLFNESDVFLAGFDKDGTLLVPSDDSLRDIIKPSNGKAMAVGMSTLGTGTFSFKNLEGGNNFQFFMNGQGLSLGSFGGRRFSAGKQTAPAFNFVEDSNSGMSLSFSNYLRLNKSNNNEIRLYDDRTEFFEPIQPPSYATGSLPAASSNEGRVAYDSTTKEMKYSDGTSWIAL